MSKLIKINIPYGGGFTEAFVPEDNLIDVFNPVLLPELNNAVIEIKKTISKALIKTGIAQIATNQSIVAIGITDRTRVTPNKLLLPELLNQLNGYGIPDQNIIILVGGGMHTPDSEEDIKLNVGAEVYKRVAVLNNQPFNNELYVECGKTSHGTVVRVHEKFVGADIRIVTGNIIPCLMAGWTGGGKTVLPGVSSKETIYPNHMLSMQQLEQAGRGSMLGVLPPVNIVRDDIEQAADVAGLHMAVNSVMNYNESIIKVLAGRHREIHREGVNMLLQSLSACFPRKADIIVSGVGNRGFEVSLYQGGSRVLQALDGVINEGGTIILTCDCREGLYEGILKEVYADWMRRMPSPEEIKELSDSGELPPEEGVVIYVFSWLIHKLKCKIVVVTEGMTKEELGRIHMEHETTLQKAIDSAIRRHGHNAGIAVLPYGSMVIPSLCD